MQRHVHWGPFVGKLLTVGMACGFALLGTRAVLSQGMTETAPTLPPSVAVASAVAVEVTPVPVVEEMIGQVHASTLYSYVGGLSGEWPVPVGGVPYTLATRYTYAAEPIEKATQYAYEHFAALGLPTAYHTYTLSSYTRRNVVAEQPGLLDPDRIFLITAHLDSISESQYRTYLAPGADDNASGSTAVWVAADILSQYNFAYTLRYVLFTGEEQGLYGSSAYAADAAAAGEDIVAVLNLDMIAYNSDDEPIVDLHARTSVPGSIEIAETFSDVVSAYNLNLTPNILLDNWLGNYSDNRSFWDQGYPAILAIEDDDDFTPHYHTIQDRLSTLNLTYFRDFVKAAVGTLVHVAGVVSFAATPPEPAAGQVVTFTGMATVNADPVTYTWSFGDGDFAAGQAVTHTFPFTGEVRAYPVVLTATTAEGSMAEQRLLPVQADVITFTYLPGWPEAGEVVTFTGIVLPDVGPLCYTWNFGDGTEAAAGNPITHSFTPATIPQNYTVTLTATHASGSVMTSRVVEIYGERVFLPLILRN